jgi:cytochrome P450
LLGFIFAGHETTAAVLSWWVKYMAAHQRVQDSLRQALHEAHAKARNEKRFPSESEIKDMHVPYLDAVIEETLRCAGVVSIVARTAICDTEISGYRIPKGTDIMVLLTGPSFNEPAVAVSGKSKISDNAVDHEPHKPSTFAWNYKDVREYRPERWLKNVAPGQKVQIFNANSGPNMPFSRGERQCLGKKQAMIQLRMAMSLLIWNFTFHRLATQFSGNARMEGMVNTPRDCFVRLSRR